MKIPPLPRFLAAAQCLLLLAGSRISNAADTIAVSQLIFPVKQPSNMSCWAAATTMLYSWKEKQSLEIRTVVAKAGQKYVNLFTADKGINPTDEQAYYQALGLSVIKQQNLTIRAWADLLKNKGPLSVTVDAKPGKGYIHALVVNGMKGDGTADKTNVTYADPADGKSHTVTFAKFLTLYEGSANWPLQIVYW